MAKTVKLRIKSGWIEFYSFEWKYSIQHKTFWGWRLLKSFKRFDPRHYHFDTEEEAQVFIDNFPNWLIAKEQYLSKQKTPYQVHEFQVTKTKDTSSIGNLSLL